jgi:hypothetical protein
MKKPSGAANAPGYGAPQDLIGGQAMTPQNDTIPVGFCQCGCGGKTAIATQDRPDVGHVKGQPKRFLRGHNAKVGRALYWLEEDRGYKTPCWIWQGACISGGYAEVWDTPSGRPVTLHRKMYQERFGPVPKGLVIDHLCRNRNCVNPDHLEAVTSAVNSQRGAAAKLTVEKVREIHALAGSLSRSELARRYGVSFNTIDSILKNEMWKNAQPLSHNNSR